MSKAEAAAKARAVINRMTAELRAMVEDRDLWKEAHDDDCPNKNMLEATEAQLQAVSHDLTVLTDLNAVHVETIAQLQARNQTLERALNDMQQSVQQYLPIFMLDRIKSLADAALAHPGQEEKP